MNFGEPADTERHQTEEAATLPACPASAFVQPKVLAQLSQLRAIFGNFAIIFVVKSCASIAEP